MPLNPSNFDDIGVFLSGADRFAVGLHEFSKAFSFWHIEANVGQILWNGVSTVGMAGRHRCVYMIGRSFSRNLVEMKRTKTKGLCCGAGGGRMFMEENLGKRINIERAQEVIASGATEVTAACPYCITMLRDGLADLNGNVVVRDIAEIIDENTS